MNHSASSMDVRPGELTASAGTSGASETSAPPALLPLALPKKRSSFLPQLLNLLPIAALLACLPFCLASQMRLRVLVAVCIFYALSACRTATSRIIAVFVYLCLMGGLRRWVIPVLGFASIDALLLIVPSLTIMRFLSSLFTRQLPRDTRLSRMIFWLVAFMALEALNPLQGGLEVGMAGIMFYIVPVLWYFEAREAAREHGTDKFIQAVVVMVSLAVPYAMFQWFYGFTAGEEMWAKASMNLASTISGSVRPMSFFNHAGEYVRFVALLAVLCIAVWVYRRNMLALLPVPALAVAVFMVGSRGSILNILTTGVAIFAVQGATIRSWLPRGFLAVVIGVVGLVVSLKQVEQQEFSGPTQSVANHMVGGLLNPLDKSKSTAGVHTQMALSGITKAFTNPAGTGLGSTTLAAMKFSGNLESTEVDITNLYVSLGLIGGTLYVYIVYLFMATAFRLWNRTRTWQSLCMLAIMIFSHFQWLNSGLYAQSMFVWTCIGLMDGMAQQEGLS